MCGSERLEVTAFAVLSFAEIKHDVGGRAFHDQVADAKSVATGDILRKRVGNGEERSRKYHRIRLARELIEIIRWRVFRRFRSRRTWQQS